MRKFATLMGVLVSGLLAVAATAYAQKEQWLEYHTSREGRGYRYLDLSTNPPAKVALPKTSGVVYYARWTTPLDPGGGRWLCLERTKKSGPYDRLYIDTKGDGRLDNKAAISTSQVDQYTASFEPVKMVFKGEDGPITYHLVLRYMQYEGSRPNLLAASGGFYAGEVDFGGKKRRVELVDGNVNGIFNDQGETTSDSDRILVEKDKANERCLGKLLEVDNQFYRIEVAHDGAFIKLQKAEDVALGKMKVPETITEVVAFGGSGHFFRKPIKGEFTLPAGHYRLQQWTIDRKDNKGATWQLMGYNFKESGDFEIATGKPASLTIGEPIAVALKAKEGTNKVDFNLVFTGPLGESIQIEKGKERPPGPKLMLASGDGIYRSTNTFEFG